MAEQSIAPSVVAEIANMVSSTLNNINSDCNSFQSDVLAKIAESWYNDNATKVMPGHVTALTNLSKGVNESLVSLGKALKSAADSCVDANGASPYSITTMTESPVQFTCNVVNNKGGHEGMDTSVIQTAVNKAGTLQAQMVGRLNQLIQASNKEGFKGGSQQADLQQVCSTLKSAINTAMDNVINDITTNTNTAKSNVETATAVTESTFTVN